ncbi:LamG domain-containing protein [Fulvivirgaceae bacterium BMA10]|uniref:LamG domain-containing protein n=1 Tax=Splendidivirga corallicola TaxID=3051826 RepID=A0ABT8KI55_9BACT|nr:LamG domain-containing protein [Fulvivirgaceae bacterium BMA10]
MIRLFQNSQKRWTMVVLSFVMVVLISACDKNKDNAPQPENDAVCSKINIAGQVMCFSFNGNADDAVGNNKGTVEGATLTSDRKLNPNAAYQFNGTSDYIRVADPSHDFEGSISIVMWMFMDDQARETGAMRLFDTRNDTFTPNISLNAYFDLTNEQLEIGGLGLAEFHVDIDKGTWFQVAIVYDAETEDLEAYINAIELEAESNTFTGFTYDNEDFVIGARADLRPGEMFHGKIDDVLVFNRALEETEITSLLIQ